MVNIPKATLEQQATERLANKKLVAEALSLLGSGADAVEEGAINIGETVKEILCPELSDEV